MVAATALGAFAGLFVATYMNAVRKLPIFRQPWEHALMMGAGAYGFNQLEAFEKRVEAELTETLAKREVSGRKFKELVNSHAHRGL